MSSDATNAPPGLLTAAASTAIPAEEIRFGVVLNGGVSLAVWMGGTVVELDRLTKARDAPDPRLGPYLTLLHLAGCRARADVVAGTSAGGINGAALALAQVNRLARVEMLRDIWVDQGRLESLLRQPFHGAPTSLLRGDEFFLPQLNDAFTRLAVPTDVRTPHEAPIDLTITATVLRGNQQVSVDSMGQKLPQDLHAGQFHWRRLPTTGLDPRSGAADGHDTHSHVDDDPFGAGSIERTAHRLALAARCTAGFPIAFEPSFVPVNSPEHREPTAGMPLTEELRLRPDMSGVVRSWGDDGPGSRDRSRFVVDGGLLANMPTRAALEAVEAMPAEAPVRRVMLLVHPHAPSPGDPPPDDQAHPPTVVGTLTGLLSALTAQGTRTFVDELDAHNRAAAGRRGTRSDILQSLGDDDPIGGLQTLAVQLFPHFRRLRLWRAGRDLALRMTDVGARDTVHDTPLPADWSFERVRRAAELAQQSWGDYRRSRQQGRPTIPYVPDDPPTGATVESRRGWSWGVNTAVGVAEAAADVLRRLVWVVPEGSGYDVVSAARATVSRLQAEMRSARRRTDDVWVDNEVLRGLEPNETYFMLRLASYERLMIGTDDPLELETLIATVAEGEGRRAAATAGPAAGDSRRRVVTDELRAALVDNASPAGSAGAVVEALVVDAVLALRPALPVLHAYCDSMPAAQASQDADLAALVEWRNVLVPGGAVPASDELLVRLLQIEVASTALGDDVPTGTTLPVEVVQLSAQTQNAFARYTRTGDEKLGGMSVNRFGGFLKRSWRVNDWMWGRLDAATILCRTVLQPARLRRVALLSGCMEPARGLAAERAAATVAEIVTALFPDGPPDARVAALARDAENELRDVVDATVGTGDLPAAMPALAHLFAWAIHLDIVATELPALAGAIRADRVEGAGARSRGEIFLHEHADLLADLAEAERRGQPAPPTVRADALEAFDRAGVGREPLRDEASSDQIIRTGTTAAAVAATVVDSDRSGLSSIKPVTRTLRGLMLLPYWVVTGLSSGAVLARSLALLGLSLGAILLTLSLFGVLPAWAAGPAAGLGVGAVLVALAYGALRTGTLLHGVVLLSPVIPLVAYAIDRTRDAGDGEAAGSAAQGVSTLVVVLALTVGLMLLGSLPAPIGSVWAALDRLADAARIPAVTTTGSGRALALGWRRAQGLVRSAVVSVVPIAALVVVVVLLVAWAPDRWDSWVAAVRNHVALATVSTGLAVIVGGTVAWWQGRRLQVLRQPTGPNGQWRYEPLSHPAGTMAGWAVLYGTGYLIVAAVIVADPFGWLDAAWGAVLLATAAVFGAALVLVVPAVVPAAAMRGIQHRQQRRAATVAAGVGAVQADGVTARHAFALDLLARGESYRFLVGRPPRDGDVPSLTRRGLRVQRAISAARSVPVGGLADSSADAGTHADLRTRQ